MSIQAIAWVLDHKLNIKPAHKLVLICLANYAGEDGQDAFPSVATIAKHTEMSERSVQRILQDLLHARLISPGNQMIPAAKGFPADRTPNCYNVEMGALIDGNEALNVRQKGIPESGRTGVTNGHTGVTKNTTGVTKSTDRGDKTCMTGVTALSPKPLYKPLINHTTNTRGENPPKIDPATDGWLDFSHEVLAASGIDPSRSMVQTGCVRQWLADAGKAGYTRQQAEAVILEVVRDRAQYGGNGKPPAWFSRPVQEAIAQGSLKSTQSVSERVLPAWEWDCRQAYHAHVLSLCNGAGKAMSREEFTEQWKKERGIEE